LSQGKLEIEKSVERMDKREILNCIPFSSCVSVPRREIVFKDGGLPSTCALVGKILSSKMPLYNGICRRREKVSSSVRKGVTWLCHRNALWSCAQES
jgi:hypothetical protein